MIWIGRDHPDHLVMKEDGMQRGMLDKNFVSVQNASENSPWALRVLFHGLS